MSDTPPPDAAAQPAQPSRNLRPLGLEINKRINELQHQYLSNKSSAPRAMLAELRRGVDRPAGSIPAIWDLTVADLPGTPSDTSAAPTREENAAHAALTLYAVHQQSRPEPMHKPRVGLGAAVRALAGPDAAPDNPARRRFDIVATATTLDETLVHLRGLVQQFRAGGIALDYGQLADDLLFLQVPSQVARVRLRWARQYYRTTPDTASTEKDS